MLSALLILPVANPGVLPQETQGSEQGIVRSSPCKCVVFRLDDIRDRYIDPVQIKIMNLFLFKGANLTLGLVTNSFGNDTLILNKIHEGEKKGLFELALHGWQHKDYANLSQQEQKSSLFKANEKMQKLFGKKSDIFIPPYEKFNKATVTVIKDLGIKILSSSLAEQYKFDQGKTIFKSTKEENSTQFQEVYFLPYTTPFKKFVGSSQIKVPKEEVAKNITSSIDKFGYAIVLIHPQSFLKLDSSGNFTNEVKKDANKGQLNEKDIEDLTFLINLMTQKGIPILSFHEIIGYK
jgi:predicted deacetylase